MTDRIIRMAQIMTIKIIQGLIMDTRMITESVRKKPWAATAVIEGTTMSKMTKSLEKRDKILAAGFYSKKRTVALRTLLVIES